jgi:hypothetical protein
MSRKGKPFVQRFDPMIKAGLELAAKETRRSGTGFNEFALEQQFIKLWGKNWKAYVGENGVT